MGIILTLEQKRKEIASIYGDEWVANQSDKRIQAIWWRMSRAGSFGKQRMRECGVNPDPINESDPEVGGYHQMSLFDYMGGK